MLRLFEDRRLGGCPRLYLSEKRDDLMLVPDEIKQCVVFLCYRHNGKTALAGTGFFVGLDDAAIGRSFVYLITAKHVIEHIQESSDDKKAVIRINTLDGASELIESRCADWKSHPRDGTADVSCIGWAPDRLKYDYKVVPFSVLADSAVVREHGIGPGDEVFFPGLFVSHFGQKRNLPLVRIGNIAAMPDEKVQTRKYGAMDALLVEARSIGGLSGSPVFAHLILGRGGGLVVGGPRFFLLGLMHGHYDSPLTEADIAVADETTPERVNMGIAIVVPAVKIADTIDQPHFAHPRAEIQRQWLQEQAATADHAASDA